MRWDAITGVANNDIDDVSTPWVAGPAEFNGTYQRTFTLPVGLAAGDSETLTFSFGSTSGSGTLDVISPVSDPVGANTGAAGTWTTTEATDLDVEIVRWDGFASVGDISVQLANNGTAPSTARTVAVTITPESGTIAYSSTGNPSNWTPDTASVATTSSPTTIEFSRTGLFTNGSREILKFRISRSSGGEGTISARVIAPDSPNNRELTENYT